MTDNNNGDKPTSEDPQSDSSAAPVERPLAPIAKTAKRDKHKPNKPVAARMSGLARFMVVLAILLSLGAAAFSGYLFYIEQQKRLEDKDTQLAFAREMQARAEKIASVQGELQTQSQQIKQDRDAIIAANQSREVLQSRMAVLEKEISLITGSHRIDWMLREIEHFITVAEQRLSLLGDARGALALMIEADGIVRAMQEPTARQLREALVKDILTLKLASESSVDVDGLFIRIGDLADRVTKLGIPSYELYKKPPASSASEAMPDDGLALFFSRFSEFLGSLVRYQKHEKVKPLLLSAERDYLAQSIVLLLQQAQLALLRGDNQAYSLSLNEAKDRVSQYIRQRTQETQFFITEVNDLASVTLRPAVPSIEASTRAVRVFREFWSKEKLIREQQAQQLKQENAQ